MASRNYINLSVYKTIIETIDSLEGSVSDAEKTYKNAQKEYRESADKFKGKSLIIKAVLFVLAGCVLFCVLAFLFKKSFVITLAGVPAGALALYILKTKYESKNASLIKKLKTNMDAAREKYLNLCKNVVSDYALLGDILCKTTGITDFTFDGDNAYGNLACINFILNSDVNRPGKINFTAAYNRFLLVRASLERDCDTDEKKQLKEEIDREQNRQLYRLGFIKHCQNEVDEIMKGEKKNDGNNPVSDKKEG